MQLRIVGLVLSGTWFLWLSLQPPGEPSTWPRVVHVVGIFGVVLVGKVLLGMAAAGLGRRRHWTPRQCRYAAMPLTLMGAVAAMPRMGTTAGHWFLALCCCGWVSGIVCRKLVHPELGWMDSDPPEPTLTLR